MGFNEFWEKMNVFSWIIIHSYMTSRKCHSFKWCISHFGTFMYLKKRNEGVKTTGTN